MIRATRPSDLDAIVHHINDRRIARDTLGVPHPYTAKHGRDWIDFVRKTYRAANRTHCLATIEIDGEAAGGIGLHIQHGFKAELGYWIGAAHRGKGHMTRAVKLMTRYAFTELGLRRVFAFTWTENRASQRVLEKAGFEREGVLRKSHKQRHRYRDSVLFARVR